MSSLALTFRFQRNKIFLSRSVKIQYCGEPPWLNGSMLLLGPPGLEFRILCPEGSVISFISQFHVVLAKFSQYVNECRLKPHSLIHFYCPFGMFNHLSVCPFICSFCRSFVRSLVFSFVGSFSFNWRLPLIR